MLNDHEDVFQGAAWNVNDSDCYYGHVSARIRVIKRRDVVFQWSIHNNAVESTILIERVFLSSSRLDERDRNILIGTRVTFFSELPARVDWRLSAYKVLPARQVDCKQLVITIENNPLIRVAAELSRT